MSHVLTDLGEEWTLKTALEGASISVGLYYDATDAVSEGDDLPLSTEPSGGNYARQSASLTLADTSSDWAAKTSGDTVFDVSSTSGSVDSYFVVANFTANDTSDSSSTDHLVATGALSQTYSLGNLDQLTVTGGTIGWKL